MRKPLGRKRICRMGERLFLETERLVTGKERQPGTRVSFTSEPSQVRKSHLRREFRTGISCRNRCLRSPASVILKLIEKHRQTRERCVNLILLRFFFVCAQLSPGSSRPSDDEGPSDAAEEAAAEDRPPDRPGCGCAARGGGGGGGARPPTGHVDFSVAERLPAALPAADDARLREESQEEGQDRQSLGLFGLPQR